MNVLIFLSLVYFVSVLWGMLEGYDALLISKYCIDVFEGRFFNLLLQIVLDCNTDLNFVQWNINYGM